MEENKTREPVKPEKESLLDKAKSSLTKRTILLTIKWQM